MAQSQISVSNKEQQAMQNASLFKGYWFYFQDGDTEIAVHGSAWSGRETVYVNDNPVSDKRVLHKLKSEHKFTHNGKEYRVVFDVTNPLTGAIECSLYSGYTGRKLLAKQTKAFIEKGNKSVWVTLLTLFLIGAGVGALMVFAGVYVGRMLA